MARAPAFTAHLVGGGPGAIVALRRLYGAALGRVASEDPLVAYVGAASGDSSGFFTMIRTSLASRRGRMKMVKLASARAPASEARSLLEEADLVFVSGGDVELGMKVLHDRDVAKTLLGVARRGTPMFGISAGSIMLARDWVRFPEDDEDDEERAELFPCLGVAPIHVDAHDEDDGWAELRVLLRLLARRGDAVLVGYGLTTRGGLRVDVGANGVSLTPIGTDTPRFVVRDGEVVAAPPLPVTP